MYDLVLGPSLERSTPCVDLVVLSFVRMCPTPPSVALFLPIKKKRSAALFLLKLSHAFDITASLIHHDFYMLYYYEINLTLQFLHDIFTTFYHFQ